MNVFIYGNADPVNLADPTGNSIFTQIVLSRPFLLLTAATAINVGVCYIVDPQRNVRTETAYYWFCRIENGVLAFLGALAALAQRASMGG
jgi:hypothetical protein